MNKIGFRIYRFKDGPSIGLTINEGEWIKKVVDIRDILKLYENNNHDESKFAMFMSFSENGAYITIARLISGRGGDNIAAWLYIPNTIEVNGSEIIPILDAVKEELSATKINDDRLSHLFSKEYKFVEAADFIPSSSEKVYASRKVGFYSLKDLMGEKRYQPQYTDYNAILISDRDSMEIIDKMVVDLSREKLVETIVFCPPDKNDLPSGVSVYFKTANHPLFNKPVRVNRSESIELIFKRSGFKDISHVQNVVENGQVCGIPALDWRMSISGNDFRIIAADDSKKDLSNSAKIHIERKELDFGNDVTLSEKEAANASITVTVNGYETLERTINLITLRKPVCLELENSEREQTWKIELSNGHYAEMTLKSKYLPKRYTDSPLRGYSVGSSNRLLEYTYFGILKQRAIGFVSAIAIGLIVWLCVALFNWYDSHTFDWQFGWPPLKIEKIVDTNGDGECNGDSGSGSDDAVSGTPDNYVGSNIETAKAIAYLDNNDDWEKDSFISYSVLNGLFEEINTYDFQRILKRKESLKDSKKFMELCDAIERNGKHKLSGNYCDDSDYEINISEYIRKKLTNNEEETTKANGDGSAGGAATNEGSLKDEAEKTNKQTKSESENHNNNKGIRGNVNT